MSPPQYTPSAARSASFRRTPPPSIGRPSAAGRSRLGSIPTASSTRSASSRRPSDGRREEADLVLEAVGIEPNLDLPAALGLPIEAGGVRLNEALRAADGVYCGGDIALHTHPVLGRPIRVEHWEVAKNQGRGIAANIVGGDTPYTKLPYFWSDQYDVNLEYRGHASGDDRAVWRGDRDGLSFSVFYLRNGLIDGVLSMNDSKTNELGGKLIESRRPVSESALSNMGVDLAELVPT